MRIPLELQHLIKTASPESSIKELKPSEPNPSNPSNPSNPTNPSLSSQLLAVEWERALEVEHFLRACALRLGLPEGGVVGRP
jgi:hypothetical protein